jgi:hypothetical protein
MSELINYNPDLIQRKIGVRESFESKCTSHFIKFDIMTINVIQHVKGYAPFTLEHIVSKNDIGDQNLLFATLFSNSY